MNCRDYETAWNDRLDARRAPSVGGDGADAHAAACAACRALGARYQALEQALRALAPPAPGADFIDRALAAAAAEPSPIAGRVSWSVRALRLCSAAAVVAAVGLGVRTWTARGPAVAPAAASAADEPDDLAAALAEATAATLDLAREASAPAARVGRQVMVVADLPAAPDAPGLPDGMAGASRVWQSVGDRVNDGVRPFGGSARHAFGFLFGTPAGAAPPPSTATGRGA